MYGKASISRKLAGKDNRMEDERENELK